MFCLKSLLTCCPFQSRKAEQLELDDLPGELVDHYEHIIWTKRRPKPRIEQIQNCVKAGELLLIQPKAPSPNFEHIIELIIDQLLEDMQF